MKYIIEQDSKKYELMGGKGTALAKLGQVIDNIPKWFAVSYLGFDMQKKEILEEATEEIKIKLKEFPNDTYFAIRSSATNKYICQHFQKE